MKFCMKAAIAPLFFLLVFSTNQAHALEPTCETYVRAAEKTARQAARHTILETSGMHIETILVGGKIYTKLDGKWSVSKHAQVTSLALAAELSVLADIRSGKTPISACRKVGAQNVEGTPTTVYTYTLKIPGMAPDGGAKVYVGADGLIHAHTSATAKVRYLYRGITAPAL
ncbi:MAG: hypothetical protein ACRERV_09805 [Methylococcales bacterium]